MSEPLMGRDVAAQQWVAAWTTKWLWKMLSIGNR